MIAITVDDESWALQTLTQSVESSNDIEDVHSFSTCRAALEWAESNEFDIAFLDINMRGIGGLELSNKLREFNPKCYIIFCTGYQEHAFEAFKHHADGFLLKPVKSEYVQREINHLLARNDNKPLINVRCFGGFEVTDTNNEMVTFSRAKTKELFAFLIAKNGMGVTSKEICVNLWEDGEDEDRKNMQYLWNLFSDLTKSLKKIEAEEILVKSGTNHLLDTTKIKCDYYDYLNGNIDESIDPTTLLPQYSWAEEFIGNLI